MRVIARSTLNNFVQNLAPRADRVTLKAHLDSWYEETTKANWKNSAELKAQFGSASILSSERVVFNIKGNRYRLIVAISYEYKAVRIKWLGSHREYDNIDAREVEYEKARYADSTHSD